MAAAESRTARVRRKTSETDIDLELALDGGGRCAAPGERTNARGGTPDR